MTRSGLVKMLLLYRFLSRVEYLATSWLPGSLTEAFRELEQKGLACLVDREDFRRSGGCFVPRHTKLLSGEYSKSLSRHSFGVAVDINPSAYPYGSSRQQPAALREIFSKWGFEVVVAKDPMHFEFVRFVPSSAEEDDEDMACAFRAFQAEKPEKEFFIDGLFTGENDFGKGRVFLAMRVEKGEHYPAVEGDAKVKVYVIPGDGSKSIETYSFEKAVLADNLPVTVEIPELGGFSLHLLVEQGSPISVRRESTLQRLGAGRLADDPTNTSTIREHYPPLSGGDFTTFHL